MKKAQAKLKPSLQAWRKKRGLTQKEAAEILGVNLRTYEGWEAGKLTPYAELIIKQLGRSTK